jgi:hypothetical protein
MDTVSILNTGNRRQLRELLNDAFNIHFVNGIACHHGNSKTVRWHYKITSTLAFKCAVSSDQLKIAKWVHNRELVRL